MNDLATKFARFLSLAVLFLSLISEKASVVDGFSIQRKGNTWQKSSSILTSSGDSLSIKSQALWSMKSSGVPPPYPVRIAVMGGGNFGLALSSIFARKGIPTTLLVREQEVADSINKNHTHPRYMSDVKLPTKVRATTNPEDALPDATYIVHAVPCQYSRAFLKTVKEFVPPGVPVLSGSKGIETISLGFMADILKEELGEDRPYAFLSGPSFAREMVEGVATAVVIASEDLLLARDLAEMVSNDSFRAFTTKDVVGVEIGGAVKNVIALAAGMCEGLGLGTNAMSGLVTRGCGEMRRLGLTFGARPSTMAGLSGALFSCVTNGLILFSLSLSHTTYFFSFQVSVIRSVLASVLSLATENLVIAWVKGRPWRRFWHPQRKWQRVLTLVLPLSTLSKLNARDTDLT